MNKKNEERIDVKKAVKILLVVFGIFAVFYALSLLITHSGSSSVPKKPSAEIQDREILLGSSFNRKDNEYLVVFYNANINSIKEAVVNYRNKKEHLPTYEVDMGNGMNSSHTVNESNVEATSAEELKISGTTLIRFKKGKIVEYIEGNDEVTEYLK